MKNTLRFWERMDLMDEPLPLQPLIELCGDRRVLIENHGAILEYGPEKIRFRVGFGSVSIFGNGLKICRMQRQTLVISGKIASVVLEGKGT